MITEICIRTVFLYAIDILKNILNKTFFLNVLTQIQERKYIQRGYFTKEVDNVCDEVVSPFVSRVFRCVFDVWGCCYFDSSLQGANPRAKDVLWYNEAPSPPPAPPLADVLIC